MSSLAQALVELIAEEGRKAECARVKRVRLEIGALSCVAPEALRFCFDVATRDTIAEGPALQIDEVPARAFCPDCDKAIADPESFGLLPGLRGSRVQLAGGGDDLRLKEMEVE